LPYPRRMMWKFRPTADDLFFSTPWFAVWIAHHGCDVWTHAYWSGIKVYWNPNPSRERGEVMFLREKTWVMEYIPARYRRFV